MFVYETLSPLSLLDVNLVNLDDKTMSFSLEFYFSYMSEKRNNSFSVSCDGSVVGYIFGNSGLYKNTPEKYTHITALSVSPLVRHCAVGTGLLRLFDLNAYIHHSKFIDLFVRVSNTKAIAFYQHNAYAFHEKIDMYYHDPSEDAWDMRKYLPDQLSDSES
ncbi:N-terminal acetyltransferase B complex catalytic subunit [Nematocida displodere]|uniref:N-terminal acetyltransferase B complex catalytic subunit n=1 Tax=Nematocida displodere TaxID=1805483 RepID=A0A177EC38_9MICR|nr:N-terminal acetyltransferase B complex catalytic subunit [Nematocida displodere]